MDRDYLVFRKQELAVGRKLRDAITSTRVRKRLSPQERSAQELRPGNARFLHALNPESRVLWGRAWFQHLRRRFPVRKDKSAAPELVFFVTIIDADYLEDDAPGVVDLEDLREACERQLAGFSFIGMIEPAYLVNVRGTPHSAKRLISWHLHLLVWGCTREELARLEFRLSLVREPTFQGVDVCKVQRVARTRIGERLAYLLKAPVNGYSLFRSGRRLWWKKSWLRPGTHARLYQICEKCSSTN